MTDDNHIEQIKDLLEKTSGLLAGAPGVEAVIIIAITDKTTDDDSKRRAMASMAINHRQEKWPLYMKMGIETLEQSLRDGPVDQSGNL